MKVRLAKMSDLQSIMLIIADAQKALAALKIDQWQDGYPTTDIFEQDIVQKKCYVAESEGNVIAVATIAFNFEPNYEHIDGQWLNAGDFAVIHRLATAIKFTKKGVAQKIFCAVEKMCRKKSISSIKIDTHEGNIPMQNLLKKNGFVYCGNIFLANGNKRQAFEKMI
jgi:GNAT superfamily N-acetyltransferase